ncbi:MAG: hypothetical protein KAU58_03285, partial [Candidatus Omnitrophica bacterium]|nr:hypothetical protein [Candidatus Omnitrophota bacterium]
MYDITWAQGGTPIWQHAKPNIELSGKVCLNGIKIPYETGTPTNVFSNGGEEVIINIQDAHASLSAQRSIVKILQNLASNYDLDLIALEGAEGPVDISLLKTFPDPEIRRETADYLMREGKMSAGEFFSIVSEKPIKLYGVENNALYKANVEALNRVMESKLECIESIRGVLNTLEALEEKIYSKDLTWLNKNTLLHKDGKLAFTAHWGFISKLAKRNNIETVIFENLSKLLKSIELEKEIDFQEANNERKLLIDELSKSLPKRELEKLVLESLLFKMGKMSHADFHQSMVRLAEDIKLSPKPYSNLIGFTRYITIYEDIDLTALFREVEEYEDYIREKIFRNEEERELYNLTKAIRTIDKLFKIALSNNDYNFITNKKKYFNRSLLSEFIRKSYMKYNLPFEHEYDLEVIFGNMDKAIGFYNIAQQRNNAMLSNTIKAMRENKEEVAALITGGFHSKGLSGIMKERGLSYLVIMPKFKEGEDRPYLAVLTNKRQPYEELLAAGEYILAVRAYFYTSNERQLLESIFYSLGLAEDKGKQLLPLKQVWYSTFKNAYEMFGEVMTNTWEHGRRPMTPPQLARILGLDDKGNPLPLNDSAKTGIFTEVVTVGGKKVIVLRQYENGSPSIEL